MKAIVQRTKGPVSIVAKDGEREISRGSFDGPGLVVLLGWMENDPDLGLDAAEEWIISRIEGLRVFPDAAGKMNLDLGASLALPGNRGGGILWVPQFTLAAKLESGFRPSYSGAMRPERAKPRFDSLRDRIKARPSVGARIFGEFGADMDLTFTNWGPVTIPLEK